MEDKSGGSNVSPVSAPEPDRRWYTPLRFLATFHFERPEIGNPAVKEPLQVVNEPLTDTNPITGRPTSDKDHQRWSQVIFRYFL